MATAYIETLKAKNAEGAETYIYPRTSTAAIDSDGDKLSDVITDLQTHFHGVVLSNTEPTTVAEGTVVFVYE